MSPHCPGCTGHRILTVSGPIANVKLGQPCPGNAAHDALVAALNGLIAEVPHTPMCGCDYEQDDPWCRVGVARVALKLAEEGS